MPQAALGMLSLGCFVGGALAIGFGTITGADYITKMTFVLGAACTGPVFTMISFFGGQKEIGEGLFAYPIGLLLALLWWNGHIATANIRDTVLSAQILGWAHLLALVAINLIVMVLYVAPVLRSAWYDRPATPSSALADARVTFSCRGGEGSHLTILSA